MYCYALALVGTLIIAKFAIKTIRQAWKDINSKPTPWLGGPRGF